MVPLLKLRYIAALCSFLAVTNTLESFSFKKKYASLKKAAKKPFKSKSSSQQSFTPGQTPTTDRSSMVIGSQRGPLTTSQRIEPQQSFKQAQLPTAKRSSINIGSQRIEQQSSIAPKKKSYFSNIKKTFTPQSFRKSKPELQQTTFASNIPMAPPPPPPPGPAPRSGLQTQVQAPEKKSFFSGVKKTFTPKQFRKSNEFSKPQDSGPITPEMLQKQMKKLYTPQLKKSGITTGDQKIFEERRVANQARELERQEKKEVRRSADAERKQQRNEMIIGAATQIGSSLVTAGTQIGSAIASAAAQKRQIQEEAALRQQARDDEQRQNDDLQRKYLRQQEEIRQLKEQVNAQRFND